MFAAINKAVTLVVNFGPGQTGKTVGYTLKNGDGTTFQARTTTGVSELQSGTGIYKVELASSVFTAAFDGYVIWDVANAAPYAAEDIYVSDRIDATISSRSTYAGGDTAGTTTLLSRLTSGRATNLDNLDHASSDLDTEIDALTTAVAALPSASTIATAVWAAATRTLTAISDSSGVTTLLARLTSGRASNLDNLDHSVSDIDTELDALSTAVGAIGAAPSAADVADAVWDEATSGHQTAGTTGKALTSAGASGDPWATLLDGTYTGDEAGSFVQRIFAKVGAIISGVSVTVQSPISQNGGGVELVRGDDYKAADGTALEWTFPWTGGDATALFEMLEPGEGDDYTTTGTFTDNGDGTATVSVDLARAVTTARTGPAYRFAVKLTRVSDGDITTVVHGSVAMKDRP